MYIREKIFFFTIIILNYAITTTSTCSTTIPFQISTTSIESAASIIPSLLNQHHQPHLHRDIQTQLPTPTFSPFLWKRSPNRTSLNPDPRLTPLPFSNITITEALTSTQTWDPIPRSVLLRMGSCLIGDSAASTATVTVTGTTVPIAPVVLKSEGTKKEVPGKVVSVVAATVVVAWFAVRVLLNGVVGVPVVRLEGMEI